MLPQRRARSAPQPGAIRMAVTLSFRIVASQNHIVRIRQEARADPFQPGISGAG